MPVYGGVGFSADELRLERRLVIIYHNVLVSVLLQLLGHTGCYSGSDAVIQGRRLQILSCRLFQRKRLAVVSRLPLVCYVVVIDNVSGIVAAITLVIGYTYLID